MPSAEPLYQRSLAISEKAFQPDHLEVGTALNNLGVFYRAQGRYAEAETFFKRALAITEKSLGPDHPNVGVILNQLGLLHATQVAMRSRAAVQTRSRCHRKWR